MKKFATILIIVGILVAVSPIVGKYYLQWQDNRLLDDWYNSVDAVSTEVPTTSDVNPQVAYGQLKDAFSSEVRNPGNAGGEAQSVTTGSAFGDASIAGTSATGAAVKAAVKTKTATPQIVLGIIKIDKINIKYPIVEGVAASNLSRAIGHIPGTAALGQPGNCALAGHRNYTFGRYFNRLDEVVVGDMISVSTKKVEYRYKVYEKIVVMPDNVSVITGSKDDTVLTLITCTPIYIATHRLILHARLEEKILLEP